MNFNTINVPVVQYAIYRLSILGPYPPYPVYDSFIFPLSPQQVRKRFMSMSAVYDTQGTVAQSGVNRDLDRYGMAPFVYEIGGTTGWSRHMTDGFQYTGQEAVNRLISMFYEYDALNAQQRLANNPYSYSMEWEDYFNGEFYQVEPYGEQEISADDRAPLLQYFRLRLVGIQPTAAPAMDVAATEDQIAVMLAASPQQGIANIVVLDAAIVSAY